MQFRLHSKNNGSQCLAGGLALLLALTGCRGDLNAATDQGKRAAKENAIAKQYLADGRYTEAKLQFEYVLAEFDGTNAEARFGKVLSELLQFVTIIRVISQLTGDDAAAADENEFLHALIDDLITDLIERFDDIAYELKRLKADPVFEFTLEQPTYVYLTDVDEPSLNLQGEWDRGEVFLLDVLVQVVLGVLNFVQAHDLRADYLGLFNKFTELDIDLDINTESIESALAGIEKEMPKIQNLVAYTLNQNPNLLALDAGTGAAQLSKAGEHFGNAIDNLRKALFFASFDIHRDNNQQDDVIAYLGRGDGQLEPIDDQADLCAARDSADDKIIQAHTFHFQLRLMFIDDDKNNVEDSDAKADEEFETTPDTGCLVSKLMDMLLPPGDPRIEHTGRRINLIDDIVPVLLSALDAADVVDFDVSNIFGGDVVASFIGNAIEFDLGPIFHSGNGLRSWLIAWDTPAMEPNPDLRLIWLELECLFDSDDDPVVQERLDNYPELATKVAQQPYRVYDRLFCREGDSDDHPVILAECNPSGALYCDTSHFPAVNPDPVTSALAGSASVAAPSVSFKISALGQDGVDAQFPYLPLLSPSLNGVIYLDVYSIAKVIYGNDLPEQLAELDSGLGFNQATQATINAYIALLSKQLGPLLELAP